MPFAGVSTPVAANIHSRKLNVTNGTVRGRWGTRKAATGAPNRPKRAYLDTNGTAQSSKLLRVVTRAGFTRNTGAGWGTAPLGLSILGKKSKAACVVARPVVQAYALAPGPERRGSHRHTPGKPYAHASAVACAAVAALPALVLFLVCLEAFDHRGQVHNLRAVHGPIQQP